MLPKICSSPDLSQHTPFAAKTLNLRLFYRGFLHYPATQLQWGARDTLECLIQAIHGHLVSIVAQIRDITQCGFNVFTDPHRRVLAYCCWRGLLLFTVVG